MTDETLSTLEEILRRLLVFMLLLCGRMAPALALEAFQESAGQVVMSAERHDSKVAKDGKNWVLETSKTGYTGSGYMRALPNTGATRDTSSLSLSPELVFNAVFTTTGTYYVWARGQAASGSDDSIHAGLDGAVPASADKLGGFGTGWTWKRDTMDGVPATLVVSGPGLHTVHIFMREDGVAVDKIVLRTSSSTTAPSNSVADSPRAPVGPPPDITAPTGTVTINNGAAATNNRQVTLTLSATDNSGTVAQMECSNDGITYAAAGPYAVSLPWTLATGDGVKTVYVRFLDAAGNRSAAATDTIALDTVPPQITILTPTNGQVITAPTAGGP